MSEIDTKLLRVFLEIHATKSISQAAIQLGLSQPTISIYLSRLRTHYGDPLFVRSSRGMEPTPFAAGLAELVTIALASIETATGYRTTFEPLTSDRTFNIAMTDISQVVILPKLLRFLKPNAPKINMMVSHISSETREQFERGDVDIAVGFMPQLDAGFYQQKIFPQRYVVIAASEHPRIADQLSLELFLSEDHVRVISTGTGHAMVEKQLLEQGYRRRVSLDVPIYLGLLEIVAGTELISLIPEGLARVIAIDTRIKVLDLPSEIALESYQVKQHWHARNHRDEGHQWLRGVIMELFLQRR